MSGVEILRAIQSMQAPLWDQFFGFVTNLHHEMVYILVLPLVYWLYDKRFGRYLFSVFALGFWTNDLLKSAFQTVRPDPTQVRVIYAETGGGFAFPSGHAQTPLIFWGAVALQVRRRWFSWVAGVVIFLIGLSRLYIGVHWPLDVIGGWLIGLLVLAGLTWSQPFWSGEKQGLAAKLAVAFAIPGAAILLTGLVHPSGIEPLVWTIAGAYSGLLVGSAFEELYVGFDPRRGGPLSQVLKVVLGLLLVLGVKEGFKLFLPDSGLGDMLRYFLVAVSATLVAPWLFDRFLTRPSTRTPIAPGR